MECIENRFYREGSPVVFFPFALEAYGYMEKQVIIRGFPVCLKQFGD